MEVIILPLKNLDDWQWVPSLIIILIWSNEIVGAFMKYFKQKAHIFFFPDIKIYKTFSEHYTTSEVK